MVEAEIEIDASGAASFVDVAEGIAAEEEAAFAETVGEEASIAAESVEELCVD